MSSPSAGNVPGGRRRIDKVLSDDFVVGLEELELDEVRARRREAEQEEVDLSYVRRMLQGRMDIIRAEISRRAEGLGDDQKIVEHLSRILSDPDRTDHGLGRFLTVEPSRVDEHRRAVEQLIADVGVSDVEGRSESDLREAIARLEEFERAVSADRHRVQGVMDSLTAEMTRRYRSGDANVEDLLAER